MSYLPNSVDPNQGMPEDGECFSCQPWLQPVISVAFRYGFGLRVGGLRFGTDVFVQRSASALRGPQPWGKPRGFPRLKSSIFRGSGGSARRKLEPSRCGRHVTWLFRSWIALSRGGLNFVWHTRLRPHVETVHFWVRPIIPRWALTMVSWTQYLGGKPSLLSAAVLASVLAAVAPRVRSSFGAEPITPIPAPAELDPRRVALGEQLFRDARLSHDNTLSCSSCHDTSTNGASANAQDRGAHGLLLPFNTPTVFNAALNFRLNWEGNVRSLEREAEKGLRNPAIMASSAEEALVKINADEVLTQRFRVAYGRAPDVPALLNVIATYELSLRTPGSRFDRWLAGETSAITSEELAGYQLFKSLGCISCHQGVNVGGNLFQRHGIFRALGTPEPELVRVPSLRNVAATAPYFHDGSASTLNEAVRQMGLAQLDRVLTDSQIGSVVAFLRTLTGEYQGRSVAPASAPPSADPVPR
jgi:cytochrome c peroxidase